jgi:hypothetical protein
LLNCQQEIELATGRAVDRRKHTLPSQCGSYGPFLQFATSRVARPLSSSPPYRGSSRIRAASPASTAIRMLV